MNNTKPRILAAVLTGLALAGTASAMNIGTEIDPVQHQADRWGGAYAQPQNRGLAESRYHFERGSYLPYQFLSQQYLVPNWQAYQLYQPPAGHQWFGIGNEYVLASVLNGAIAQVLRR